MLNTAKKKYLKSLAPGVSTVLVCSCTIDDIYESPECEVEHLIKERMMKFEKNMVGNYRPWFSENLFEKFIDKATDAEILLVMNYLEARDFGLKQIQLESSIAHDDCCGRLISSGLVSSAKEFFTTKLV